MGDQQAVVECGLSKLVESTFRLLYCKVDCAYTPMEKLLPIYGSEQVARERYDNYNFYASQLCIHIEMAFGLMVKRWSILQRCTTISIHNIKHLICSIGVLHNYCVNEQIVHCVAMVFLSLKHQLFSRRDGSAKLCCGIWWRQFGI